MKTGVLFVHGFTGGEFEVKPLITFLQQKTDWEIVVPILPGHDNLPTLDKMSAESWLMEAEIELKKLRKKVDRVYVIGFSMGGLIALYLALRYPIDKVVLLSAAAKYLSPRILLEEAMIMLSETVRKQEYTNQFYRLYSYKIKQTPIRAAFEFLRTVKTVEAYYDRVQVPVCIVQGKKDEIVPFSTGELLYKKIGSEKKRLIFSEMGKHHICYSRDCEAWFKEVLTFLQEN